MSRTRTVDTTYLVAWPDDLVIKAGVSVRKRWMGFVNRGAVLVETFASDVADTYALEKQLVTWLRENLPGAFDSSAEAIGHLGDRGGGWAECFRAANQEQFDHALKACARIMRAHDARSKSSICTDGRTDERHGEITHVTHKSSLTDTCARVQDFDDFSGRINSSRSERNAWDA